MLKSIRESATEDYNTCARFMGWQQLEEIEQEEASEDTHILPVRERYSFKVREFWLREHMQLPADTAFEANIIGETPKAYHVEVDGWSGWLPKSLIKSQVKVESAESLQNFPDTEKSKYI
jgi:ribosomal protein S1